MVVSACFFRVSSRKTNLVLVKLLFVVTKAVKSPSQSVAFPQFQNLTLNRAVDSLFWSISRIPNPLER